MKSYFEEDYTLLKSLGLEIKKSIHSPIREDKRKSFSIYINKEGNIRWKDFGTGEGGTVLQLYQIITKNNISIKPNKKDIEEPSKKQDIIIQPKPYTDKDLNYWNKYYVDCNILNDYKVNSLDSFTYKNKVYYNHKYMFAIRYEEGIYKIYMPESKFKFFHNCNNFHIFGHHNINKEDKRIIITKSFKDVLVLRKLGYNSISVMCETINPLSLQYYINLFINNNYKMYILFDNDKAGIKNVIKWKEVYPFIHLLLLDKYKDISDYIKSEGIDVTKNYLNILIDKI